jgi:osmotically-inducible protein OsmY
MTEHYQRGGSGSEGGSGAERSHGTSRGYTDRGGGTGLRDDERWAERNRERFGSREYRDHRDYGQSASGSSFANTGYGSGWGGGLSGFAGSASTYMDRGQQGRFSGRGPKGWRRSDERIREDVCERLTMHPDIDASDIDVQVREAEVILTGVVDDRHAKRLAEEIIENISGLKDVNNQIRIRRMEERGRDARDQGLGSGFDTSTGNRGEAPLGLNQPGQQRPQQQTGQYSVRPQSGSQYGGQQSDQPSSQQPQYSGAIQHNRTNR